MFEEELGAVSVTFMDSKDTPILNHYPEKLVFGEIRVMALFDAETDMQEIVAALREQGQIQQQTAYKVEQIEAKIGNVNGWIIFHPLKFGRLWICPSWREILIRPQ